MKEAFMVCILFNHAVSFPQRVAEVTDSWWHSMLILPPLFKESPASPFLTTYYPDCVGMSPSGSPSHVSLTELRADHCRAVPPQSKSVSVRGMESFRRHCVLCYYIRIITLCSER